jgi:hypothetical protein
VTAWSNAVLLPPAPPLLALISAAGQHEEVADAFVGLFNDPPAMWALLSDPDPVAAIGPHHLAHVAPVEGLAERSETCGLTPRSMWLLSNRGRQGSPRAGRRVVCPCFRPAPPATR